MSTEETIMKLATDLVVVSLNEPDVAVMEARIDLYKEVQKLVAERDALKTALTDTLDFCERHSNRWDGINGKHPFTVVEAARAALKGKT